MVFSMQVNCNAVPAKSYHFFQVHNVQVLLYINMCHFLTITEISIIVLGILPF